MPLEYVTVEGERGDGYQSGTAGGIGIDPFGGSQRQTPATVNIIPQSFIEDRAPQRMLDLTDYLPGVNARETNGGTGNNALIIRGFQTSNEVSLNGQVRRGFSNPSRGYANIERVEVLKGSAGVEAGVVDPGGVVNFVTKKPAREAAHEVRARVGYWDLYGASLDATGPLGGGEEFLYRFIAEGETRASFRNTYEQERVLVAPSLQWNYAPRSSALLELEYIYQDQAYDRGIFYLEGAGLKNNFAPIEFSAHEPGDSLKTHAGRVSLYLDHRLTEVFLLRGRATYLFDDSLSKGARNPNLRGLYMDYRRRDNRFSGNSTIRRSYTLFDGKSRQLLTEAEALAGFNTGALRHDLLLGLDYTYYDHEIVGQDGQTVWPLDAFKPVYGTRPRRIGRARDGVGRDFDFAREWTYKGVYTQYKLTARERLHILGGVRFDKAEFANLYTNNINTDPPGAKSRYGDEVLSYRLGAAYDLSDRLTLYAGFSNAFVPQAGRDRRGGRFAALESASWDGGLKFSLFDEQALLTLSAFDITQSNLTEPDPANLPGESFRALIGEVNSRGVEATLSGRVSQRLDLLAGAAWLDTEITKSNSGQQGNRAFGVPRLEASVWGRYDFSALAPGFSAALGLVHVGEREGDNANSFKLTGYTRIDAGVFYSLGDLRLELRAENLFDTIYYRGSQNRPGNIIPGAPRSILASFSFQF